MSVHRVDVQTLKPPKLYSAQQLERAMLIALHVNRGRFVYCLPPEGQR